MKKRYLVATILATALLAISCAQPKPIPPAAISEIYAMSEAEAIKQYVEVKDVSDRGDYCYVMIYIKSLPGEFTSLEDALPQAKIFTRTFTEAAVKILSRYDINKGLSVWAQLPLKEGGVTVLGHAEYDGKKYRDFELYKP
ncbi:MAG: hypothetical protein Q8O43_06425 [Dehalococcoidia bacterium]|nr:hypothetical protein [Dehalococcoidia bacterium]